VRLSRMALPFVLALGFVSAQDRDFLTSDEVDQIREAQDPNMRLQLYVQFAKVRVALVQQLLSKEKPGRTALVHDTLEDYSHIIEAIDTVADDALKRKADLAEGMKGVAAAEKEMAETLAKLDTAPQKDYARYEFVLKQAIETTRDSADLSSQDLNARASAVAEREKKDRKELESSMRPEDVKKKEAEEKKETAAKKKAPTLRRKSEKPPDQQQNP
jgi:hypothetical protein